MSQLNIVIPMAGRGSRFADAGYTDPKPLINVSGKPMIQVVVENLRPSRDHRFIFICQREHVEQYDLVNRLQAIAPGSICVPIDGITEGAACTVLLAEDYINNDDPMVIANSDQWVDASMDDYLQAWDAADTDGFIMTMTSNLDKWSYIQYSPEGDIQGVVEKVPVSDQATVGIYNFKHGSDYCKYAHQMIAEDNRSKGEFYVAPVYDYLLKEGKTIGTWSIGSDQDGMYGLGTPQDLDYFLSHPIVKKIA